MLYHEDKKRENMKKSPIQKALIKLCAIIIIFFVLLIWTIWGNTVLTVSNIKSSSSRIHPTFSGCRSTKMRNRPITLSAIRLFPRNTFKRGGKFHNGNHLLGNSEQIYKFIKRVEKMTGPSMGKNFWIIYLNS